MLQRAFSCIEHAINFKWSTIQKLCCAPVFCSIRTSEHKAFHDVLELSDSGWIAECQATFCGTGYRYLPVHYEIHWYFPLIGCVKV